MTKGRLMAMLGGTAFGVQPTVKRRCFLSYHHADQDEVRNFVKTFYHDHGCFTGRGLGLSEDFEADIIASNDTDYVMRRIRELYLKGSTVTLVMLGRCTWARRYVDWEIQASLRRDRDIVPNGLLGIKLPSYANTGQFPDRLNKNLGRNDCYARWMAYPNNTQSLVNAIEAAYQRRTTHANQIINPRDRMSYNRTCN